MEQLTGLLQQIQTNGLSESALLPMVLNMSLTASVIIGCVLLARLALRRAPRIFSYALWAVVLFRLLCPVSLSTEFSLLGLLDTPTQGSGQHTTAVEYVPYDVAHTPELEVQLPVPPAVNDAVNTALPQEHAALGADPLEGPLAIATLIWLAVMLAMAAYSVVSLLRLRRQLVGAVPLEGNVWLADHIRSPFVLGLLRPRIYLPSSLPERERAYILLHEQHHIRRLDHVVKLLAFLALCIHWFNPLVWVSFVLLERDMEMSCDEAVLKRLGADIRADYSASLLSLATGRRIIAGTPLAFGEGNTRSRVQNVLRWRKPRQGLVLLAAAACVLVIAACAANPRQGRYARMEDYAREVMSPETVTYSAAGGSGEATAQVTDRRIVQLDKVGELAGLDPAGTLEAWTFSYEVQLDVPEADALQTGIRYAGDGWFDLEGQGGHNLVALRYTDGSYKILYDEPVSDNMDFYGHHTSYEEALYDWYVTENGLDLPRYVEDWGDAMRASDPEFSGSFPVRRYDGDGWYLYVPLSGWAPLEITGGQTGITTGWGSTQGTGTVLVVDYFTPETSPFPPEADASTQPLDPDGYVWETQAEDWTRDFFTETAEGGCWRVRVQVPASGTRDPAELDILTRMAESFTPDAGTADPAAGAAQLSDALLRLQIGDPVTLLQRRGDAGTVAYDNCWPGSTTAPDIAFAKLRDLTWSPVENPENLGGLDSVTLRWDSWRLTAYAGRNEVFFSGPASHGWLTADAQDARDNPYELLQSWCDELEYTSLGGSLSQQRSIRIPDQGQPYLEAAGTFAETVEGLHLQASSGSQYCYAFVETHVADAADITAAKRERGEIGDRTHCFTPTTVFVPENERARQRALDDGAESYTGSDPNIPADALQYSRCGYITQEYNGWHGEITGADW